MVRRKRLENLREMYEPYVDALARYLQVTLPPWISPPSQKDNWQTSAWDTHREQ